MSDIWTCPHDHQQASPKPSASREPSSISSCGQRISLNVSFHNSGKNDSLKRSLAATNNCIPRSSFIQTCKCLTALADRIRSENIQETIAQTASLQDTIGRLQTTMHDVFQNSRHSRSKWYEVKSKEQTHVLGQRSTEPLNPRLLHTNYCTMLCLSWLALLPHLRSSRSVSNHIEEVYCLTRRLNNVTHMYPQRTASRAEALANLKGHGAEDCTRIALLITRHFQVLKACLLASRYPVPCF